MKAFHSLAFKFGLLVALGASLLAAPKVQAQAAASGSAWIWKDIAVGVTHSLAVKNDGTVWAWGDTPTALTPKQVPRLTDMASVAGGQGHSMALARDGSVWTWGSNHDGELGDGTKVDRAEPQQVPGIADVVFIDADWTRSFAVKKDGTVWGWGGFYYRGADGSVQNPDSPAQLNGLENVVAVSAGYGNFMALKSDGTVWYYADRLTQVAGLTDIVQIAVGAQYTYGLKKDGTVWYWGANGVGMVSGISAADSSSPQMIPGIKDVAAIQASAGGPLMLKKDGTVWASGDNPGGQLGIGSYKPSEVPVQVAGLRKITRIAAHGVGYRSMAIRADGTLWSWGIGYVGDGTKWNRTTPVGIPGFQGQAMDMEPIFVELDGAILAFEQPPAMINNRTLVPLRAIVEAMGADVKWYPATSAIKAAKGDVSLELVVGKTDAQINGKTVKLEAPPTIINNYTMVPLRFISEAFGAKVVWDADNKTIVIQD